MFSALDIWHPFERSCQKLSLDAGKLLVMVERVFLLETDISFYPFLVESAYRHDYKLLLTDGIYVVYPKGPNYRFDDNIVTNALAFLSVLYSERLHIFD